MHFVKLFDMILDSSIWSEKSDIRVVWITMLLMADKRGFVRASVSGIARRAAVGADVCQEALDVLEAPDKDSRTSEHEGRRIVDCEGGYQILNYEKYRLLLAEEERRSKGAERQARYVSRRQQASASVSSVSNDANDDKAEVEVEAEEDSGSLGGRDKTGEVIASCGGCGGRTPRKRGSRPRTRLPEDFRLSDQCIAFAKKHGWLPEKIALELEKFVAHALGTARLQADWRAAWRTWVLNEPQFSRASGSVPAGQTTERYPEFKPENIKPIDPQRQQELAAKIANIGKGAA